MADITEVSLFEKLSSLGHEQVVFCHDQPTGLKAIIGIHSTVLGPSMGGTRMWNYESEQEAIKDVLRLSRGMTYKAAITGLNIGGGKAVIIGDARKLKNEAFMRMFGKFVNSLGGKYYTAEDVNMSTRDMQYIAMETKYVTGLPISMGGGGDPSLLTAYGTYMGIKGTAKKVYGSDTRRVKMPMRCPSGLPRSGPGRLRQWVYGRRRAASRRRARCGQSGSRPPARLIQGRVEPYTSEEIR